jgi:MoxR-like ATPase
VSQTSPLQAQESLHVQIQTAVSTIRALKDEVGRIFFGQPAVVNLVVVALVARGHVLLEGVPGVAKTTLMKAFSTALGCSAKRIQFTPDLLPSDITGTYVYSPRDGTFSLRQGPIFANVVLADEVNRAPPKTQAALLEAMQERQVTIEGDRYELPSPFMVLATQNPVEMEGTYPLPEAQIDRFLLCVPVGYPGHDDEVRMIRANASSRAAEARTLLNPLEVERLQTLAAAVHVEDDLLHYAVSLAEATRKNPRLALGLSPRGTLSLMQAAKAHALCAGRAFVTPDDIRLMAPSVIAHRILVSSEVDDTRRIRDKIVEEVLARVSYRPGAAG